jgi:hypothetical protein
MDKWRSALTGITVLSLSLLLATGSEAQLFDTRLDFDTGYDPNHVVAGDLNGDGRADLVTANENGDSVSVLLNNGDGPAPHDHHEMGEHQSS